MKQNNREDAYDRILRYLYSNKGGRSIKGILQNVDDIYSERRSIMKDLIDMDYVSKSTTEHGEEYFSLTDHGKRFVRSSSFSQKRRYAMYNRITAIIVKACVSVGGIVAAIYYALEIFDKCGMK